MLAEDQPASDRSSPSWSEHIRRLRRRAVTLTALAVVSCLLFLSLPMALLLLALLDLLKRTRPWARCRAWLSICWIALCEGVGVAGAFAVWLWYLVHRSDRRFEEHNTTLQRLWTDCLFAGSKRIYGMRVETEGPVQAVLGPVIVLVRHASLVDTVLTAAVVANPNRLNLRYVLKDELLNDPCIDIVGHRLRNAFVSRGDSPESDIARVRALAYRLQSDEGVLIYPEGTRFTPRKLKKVRKRLEDDPIMGPAAAGLRHVLPPRPGGTLALLEEAPEVDVLFVAHKGLEGAATLADFWRGELVGTPLRVCAWRVAADDIPPEAGTSPAWLLEKWAEMDEWLERA